MPLRIADYDRPKFLSVARAKDVRIEGKSLRQLSDVIAVYRTVASQLGQREIMRVEREDPQALKPSGEEVGQTLPVRLGKTRHSDVLKVKPMFLGKRGLDAIDVLQRSYRVVREHLDIIEVVGWARQVAVEGGHESAETVNLNRPRQLPVDVKEEGPPRIRQITRRSGAHLPSSPSRDSSA